jgi:hypothetical protein
MDSISSNPKKCKALTDAHCLLIRKRNETHPPAHQKDLAQPVSAPGFILAVSGYIAKLVIAKALADS